jgi:hypothetical protein
MMTTTLSSSFLDIVIGARGQVVRTQPGRRPEPDNLIAVDHDAIQAIAGKL